MTTISALQLPLETSSTPSDDPAHYLDPSMVEDWPDLSYWFGLGWSELCSMPNWAVKLYADALPRLLAHSRLMAIEAASFPYAKRTDQRAIEQRLQKDANPPMRAQQAERAAHTARPQITHDEHADAAAAMGISVRT